MEALRKEILEVVKNQPKISFVDIVRHFSEWDRANLHEQLALMTTQGMLKKSMDKGVACYETP